MAAVTLQRSQIPAGITACLQIAQSRLDEARALLQAGSYTTQAAVLISFAVEEFGKTFLLRTAHETGDDPASGAGFYDHEAKNVYRRYVIVSDPDLWEAAAKLAAMGTIAGTINVAAVDRRP